MQDVIIENCVNGLVIVGGVSFALIIARHILTISEQAGGSMSTGQSVGSLILMDALIVNATNGIVTSLFAENSTSFLLQNSVFRDVTTAVLDSAQGTEILAGGAAFGVESWGFGRVATSSTNSTFYNGQDIPVMERPVSLTYMGYDKPNFFQRRRPAYTNIGNTQIIDVKEWGAAGDGTTNDGPILNSILDRAANLSAIVFIPHGIYIVEDTLHIPVGSRIIGQAWSQIMMKGSKFENQLKPRVGVQVGQVGDVGIIEIQSLLFTVSGPTAGAVLVEWNVHQSTQGSAAMWGKLIIVLPVPALVGNHVSESFTDMIQRLSFPSWRRKRIISANLPVRQERYRSQYSLRCSIFASTYNFSVFGLS